MNIRYWEILSPVHLHDKPKYFLVLDFITLVRVVVVSFSYQSRPVSQSVAK